MIQNNKKQHTLKQQFQITDISLTIKMLEFQRVPFGPQNDEKKKFDSISPYKTYENKEIGRAHV